MASSFKEVARVSDMGEPSLHLYSVDVKLPMLSGHPNRIIQVSLLIILNTSFKQPCSTLVVNHNYMPFINLELLKLIHSV